MSGAWKKGNPFIWDREYSSCDEEVIIGKAWLTHGGWYKGLVLKRVGANGMIVGVYAVGQADCLGKVKAMLDARVDKWLQG